MGPPESSTGTSHAEDARALTRPLRLPHFPNAARSTRPTSQRRIASASPQCRFRPKAPRLPPCVVRHWNVTARVKRTQRKMRRTKTENQKLIRRESKVRHDLTFINSDATRDGEGSVWRLVGPGSDSELIRPRCALRRGAACGLETRASIDSLYKLEESQ